MKFMRLFGAISDLTGNGFSISRFLACLFVVGFSEKWGSVALGFVIEKL
jgi:hypothetical protein